MGANKRPHFKVEGGATIKHLNVRKEGPEDEKILAVDVKLEIEKVGMLIVAYFDAALAAFLWVDVDKAGTMLAVRNAFLQPVQYAHQIEGATVSINGRVFLGCEVKKFAINPRDGGLLDLTCSVTLYPTGYEVGDLAELVQDGARVVIDGPPDLFDGDGGAAAAGNGPAQAAAELDSLMREGGTRAELKTAGGETLATFGDGPDLMLEQAKAVVLEHKRASISLVQRYLRIGYNRAARLLEALEAAGVVSAMDASGNRTINAAREAAQEQTT